MILHRHRHRSEDLGAEPEPRPMVAVYALLATLAIGLFVGACAKTWLAALSEVRESHSLTLQDVPSLRNSPDDCTTASWGGDRPRCP